MTYSPELNDSMAQFFDALKAEYGLYQQIFAIAERERAAITSMDNAAIRLLNHQKEELLSKRTHIETRIGHLSAAWQEAEDLIKPELSLQIKSFLAEFAQFVKKLVDYGAENERLFVEKNNLLQQELGQVRHVKKAHHAYVHPEYKPMKRHTDITG